MDLKSIPVTSVRSLADLVPKVNNEPLETISQSSTPNSPADLVPGSNYHSTALLSQLGQIEQEAEKIRNQNPLSCLAALDDENLAIKLATIIISKGATNNHDPYTQGEPCVMSALLESKFDLAKHLINNGFSINARNEDGNTVLHRIQYKDLEERIAIVQFALEHGLKASEENKLGHNIVQTAIDNNIEAEVIAILDPDGSLTSQAHISLFALFDQGRYEELKTKIRSQDVDNIGGPRNNTTLLNEAIKSNNLDMVEFLLEKKADPNLCLQGKTYLYQAIVNQKDENIALALLAAGANPDLLNSYHTAGGQYQCRTISMLKSEYHAEDRISPRLVEAIQFKTHLGEPILERLKGIVDSLFASDYTYLKPASPESVAILQKLGIYSDGRDVIGIHDLITAFNQVMLKPNLVQAYRDFDQLTVNYHGAETILQPRLDLIKFGHGFITNQIQKTDAEVPSISLCSLYLNRAFLGTLHNAFSGQELFNPNEITNDFREAKSTAESIRDYNLVQTITTIMGSLDIPTFE